MAARRANLPGGLPFLPGNSYADPTVTRYHKTQLLGLKDGAITEQTKAVEENIDQDLLASLREGNPVKLSGVPARREQENDSIPKNAPKWLKHDRQVLKFIGYFQEPVVENCDENFRVRKIVLMYHLDDDTIYITEKKQENSGIPQGVFLKRHKIPKGRGQFWDWSDLRVGENVEFYNRVYRLTECDDFTRNFFGNEGINLQQSEPMPDNLHENARTMMNMKQNPPDLAETKEYVEVKLKGGHPNRGLSQYLENDRKVLSFRVLWDDVTYDGGEKFYTLNYFLADSTMEVKEIRTQNSGKDPFPMMLKKMKVPKTPVLTHYPGMSLKKEDYYLPQDIVVGKTVTIYGRECLIYDCDDATRQWYRENFGIEVPGVPLKKGRPNVMYQPVPSYNGIGSEEDSMGSIHSLNPKPPAKDVKKMFKSDMHVLRFESKLVSTEPDDESRKFIISFFCGDDTIMIHEVCDKNSGRIGGKFMDRKKHKSPVHGAYYEEKDFLIGNTIYTAGWKFQLVKADEYTEKYMEDNPEMFPQSSLDWVIEKIMKKGKGYPSLQEYVIDLMKKLDRNGDGVISFEEFSSGLKNLDIFITDHEEHTLMRRFDSNNDNKISMEEFYNTLASFA